MFNKPPLCTSPQVEVVHRMPDNSPQEEIQYRLHLKKWEKNIVIISIKKNTAVVHLHQVR